jgi:hypothetical protein
MQILTLQTLNISGAFLEKQVVSFILQICPAPAWRAFFLLKEHKKKWIKKEVVL